jgi:P27 family predicted phage terminase small subunit
VGVMPGRRLDPTMPPPELDKRARRLWQQTLAQLKAQGTWKDTDWPLLERYVRAWERALLAREGMGGEVTTKGSMGQLVQHPNLKTARDAEHDAHQYATDLLLTPASRKRAGLDEAETEDGPYAGAF